MNTLYILVVLLHKKPAEVVCTVFVLFKNCYKITKNRYTLPLSHQIMCILECYVVKLIHKPYINSIITTHLQKQVQRVLLRFLLTLMNKLNESKEEGNFVCLIWFLKSHQQSFS